MNAMAILIAFCLAMVGADVEGSEFSAQPILTKIDGKQTVAFAVSSPTDVEVAVLDAAGQVVRHLAAGVLGGPQPPPAPLRPGLSQSITWDGKDDLGQPARNGPFRIRVCAGTSARLGGIIGDPAILEEKVYGLATDEKGCVYVATGGGYGRNLFTIKVFNRGGKYLRTIMPYPASLKAEEVAGFGKQAFREGRLAPPQYDALLPWIYPHGLGALMGNRVQDGVLWLTDGAGHVCRLRAADGACISWGEGASPAPPAQGPICWAVAPDGRTLYLAGWYYAARKVPDGRIFKVDPSTGARTEFLSTAVPPDSFWLKEPNGWYDFTNWGRKNGLAALHGLAVDAQERIYVCDRVGQRLAVYDAAGKLLGHTPVEHPDLVAVRPRGPEIYVATRRIIDGYKARNEIRLLKLSGWKDGQVLAALTLPGSQAPSMAVDATAEPAVIWLSNVGDGQGVTRIEDRGRELVVTGKLASDVSPMPTALVKIWADPLSDDIVVSNGWSGLARFDGTDGTAKAFPLSAIDLAFGPRGEYYVYGQKGWHELVTRFDRQFQPLPFSATGKNTTSLTTTGKDVYGRYGHGWSNKGLCVGPDGRMYVYNMYDWSKYFVNIWDANGQAEKHGGVGDGLIGPLDPQGGGLAVDFRGNLYVGLHGFPKDHADGRPTEGSVVKFGPAGGGYVAERGTKPGIEWQQSQVGRFVEGALAAYPGLGAQVAGGCVCKEARFDLDGFGRLYIPNALDYCVRVVDNAGNEVVRFGHYGNPDAGALGNVKPSPEIPLGWPIAVSVGRRGRVYVADTLNHRIVRVELSPSAAVECQVK
jgi:sugar lactone lactonase YvrE